MRSKFYPPIIHFLPPYSYTGVPLLEVRVMFEWTSSPIESSNVVHVSSTYTATKWFRPRSLRVIEKPTSMKAWGPEQDPVHYPYLIRSRSDPAVFLWSNSQRSDGIINRARSWSSKYFYGAAAVAISRSRLSIGDKGKTVVPQTLNSSVSTDELIWIRSSWGCWNR